MQSAIMDMIMINLIVCFIFGNIAKYLFYLAVPHDSILIILPLALSCLIMRALYQKKIWAYLGFALGYSLYEYIFQSLGRSREDILTEFGWHLAWDSFGYYLIFQIAIFYLFAIAPKIYSKMRRKGTLRNE